VWTYESGTGRLYDAAGELVATGYSGADPWKNRPAGDHLAFLGPIPVGHWTIHAPQYVDKPGPHGPYVLPLTPDINTDTHGRDSFLIHGDSIDAPGTASQGCIILDHATRERMYGSRDWRLLVEASIPVRV
jgi:Protein of unknown function (DUF2778)